MASHCSTRTARNASGKYRGRSVADVLRADPGYYSWMMTGDFTFNTKQVLTRIRLKGFNK